LGGEQVAAGRNLVVCCDGTNNQFGSRNTNVVRLLSVLDRDPERQVAFYDPGVGTFSATAALTPAAKTITKWMGSLFGYGVSRNIADIYEFLIENFNPGDRIFLFGFSRGAYAVRALASLIHTCGLPRRPHRNLVPYAIELFKSEAAAAGQVVDREERATGTRPTLTLPQCGAFAAEFSATPDIHFLGLWDTVNSVGSLYNPLKLPFSRWNPSVRTVRQAMSIDERRKFFRQNLWSRTQADVKQVWFAGVHSDVGGGYPEDQSELALVSFAWMIAQAQAAGLRVDADKLRQMIPDPDPAASGDMHDELRKLTWKVAQLVPRRYWIRDPASGKFIAKWQISPEPQPRFIEPGASIHHTVQDRIRADATYRPVNLPHDAVDETGRAITWADQGTGLTAR
jgi:uncharacterized protein (DUF2235 family)